jgi:HK97 family phage prohead protease/HK97 family phage major capsid protein
MPIKPNKDESQSDFMARCMSDMSESEDRTQEQNVAACLSMWRDANKSGKTLDMKQILANWKNVQEWLAKQDPEDFDVTPEDDESAADFYDRCIEELTDGGVDETEAEDYCEVQWENRDATAILHKTTATAGSGMDFILSDATPDRMGDIITVESWDFDNFSRNPVALFNHKSDFPIGTWTNIRRKDKALRGSLVLAPRGISPRLDEVRGLVEAGILRAVSVGFKGIERKPRTETKGYVFTKSELVEVSLVSIPANPNALAVAKSLNISEEIRTMVFAEHGNKNTTKTPARVRAENGSDRRRAITGKNAEIPKVEGKSMPMLLSKRVEDATNFLVQLQDQLQQHLSNVDDQNVNDQDMAITEDLNIKIANAQRNRDNLIQAEQRLAKSSSNNGNGNSNGSTGRSVIEYHTNTVAGGGPRPFNLPAKKINPLDFLIRQGIIAAFSHTRRLTMDDARRLAGYGDDEATKAFVDYAMKASTAPAMTTVTGWAAELVQTIYGEFLNLLVPSSVMPRLAAKGLALNFGRAGKVIIPTRSATPSLAGSFVGEGLPIPVRQGAFTAISLIPKKLGVITTWTRELDEHSIPAVEGVLRDAISTDTGVAIDNVLLDTNPATAIRPAGIRNGVAGLTPTAGGGFNALVGDIKQLTGALLTATAGHIRSGVFLMNPQQVLSISLTQPTGGSAQPFPFADDILSGKLRQFSVIESGNVPIGTVIFMDAADFVVVGAEAPRFEVSDQATLHFDDTNPTDITGGTPSPATPVKSMFQTDSIALRLIWPLNWSLRRTGLVSWVTGVTWSIAVMFTACVSSWSNIWS